MKLNEAKTLLRLQKRWGSEFRECLVLRTSLPVLPGEWLDVLWGIRGQYRVTLHSKQDLFLDGCVWHCPSLWAALRRSLSSPCWPGGAVTESAERNEDQEPPPAVCPDGVWPLPEYKSEGRAVPHRCGTEGSAEHWKCCCWQLQRFQALLLSLNSQQLPADPSAF